METNVKEFNLMLDQMKELKENGNVWVEVESIDKFCDLCRVFNLNPQGGAIADDCRTQIIYIDKPQRDQRGAVVSYINPQR